MSLTVSEQMIGIAFERLGLSQDSAYLLLHYPLDPLQVVGVVALVAAIAHRASTPIPAERWAY